MKSTQTNHLLSLAVRPLRTVMTQTQKQWWEQECAKGEARFVLREGLLRRGLPFATIMTGVRVQIVKDVKTGYSK